MSLNDLPELTLEEDKPLDPKYEIPNGLTLQDPSTPAVASPAAADRRAKDINFAMMGQSPGYQFYYNGIIQGKEGELRYDSAQQKEQDMRNIQMGLVKDAAATVGRPFTEPEMAYVLQVASYKPPSVDTVWEQQFGSTFTKVAALNNPTYNEVWRRGFNEVPSDALQSMDRASSIVSRNRVVDALIEDMTERFQSMPAVHLYKPDKLTAYFANWAIPFWGWSSSNNAIGNNPKGSWGKGSNRDEQLEMLWRINDIDEFRNTLVPAMENMYKYDPVEAIDFLHKVKRFGVSDQWLGDVNSLIEVGTLVPFGMLRRWGWKATEAVSTIPFKRAEEAAGALKAAEGTVVAPEKINAVRPSYELLSQQKREWNPVMLDAETQQMKQLDLFRFNTPSGQHEMFPNPVATGEGRAPTTEQKLAGVTDKERDELYTNFAYRNPDPDKGERLLAQHQAGERALAEEGPEQGKENVFRRVGAGGRIQREKAGPGFGTPTQEELDLRQARSKNIPALDKMRPKDYPLRKIDENLPDLPLFPGNKEDWVTRTQMNKASADIVQSSVDTPMDPVKVLARIGDTKAAAQIAATQELQALTRGMDPLHQSGPMMERIPALYKPGGWFDDSTVLADALIAEAKEKALVDAKDMLAVTMVPNRVTRLSEGAEAAAVTNAINRLPKEWRPNSEGVIAVKSNGWDPQTNTLSVSVNLGKRSDKTLFSDKDEAFNFATAKGGEGYGLDPANFFIRQEGSGFVIDIPRNVSEIDRSVRGALIDQTTRTPQGMWHSFMARFKTPEDTLSALNRQQRGTAMMGMQVMRTMIKEHGDVVRGLSGQERADFFRMLEANRDYYEPLTGQRGMFHTSAGEFERAWNTMYGKPATPNQVIAYDQYVRLNNLDWALREMGWHRDKARLGVMNYRFSTKIEGAEPNLTRFSERFEGKKVEGIDWNLPAEEGIWLNENGVGRFFFKNDIRDSAFRSQISRLINEEGYSLIKIFAPLKKPLEKDTGNGAEIHYLLSDSVEETRLQLGQHSTFNAGGHVIYQNPWFVKQAIVREGNKGTKTYYGDFSFRGGYYSEQEAREWADKYETARVLFQLGENEKLDAYVKANLPMTTQEFKANFHDKALSIDDPITVTYTGRNVFESNPNLKDLERYRDFKDTLSSPSNMEAALNHKFLADRGPPLMVEAAIGSENNPAYKLVPGKLIDPFNGLQRGLSNIIRSTMMDDYKISSAEHWISQWWRLMDRPQEQLDKNPVHYLYNPQWSPGVSGNPSKDVQAQLAIAKAERENILSFLGVQSELGAEVSYIEQKIAQSFGENIAEKMYNSPRLLAAIKDPASFFRATTFHALFGFNPRQLLLQGMGSLYTTAVLGPAKGWQAFAAARVAWPLRLTEDARIIEHGGNITRPWGWEQQEFVKAYNGMRTTGFDIVGGSSAWRDNFYQPTVWDNGTDKAFSLSAGFFDEGEKINHLVGWFGAWKKWTSQNPGKEVGQRELGEILAGARLLTADMDAAAKATWEKHPVAAFTTQFMTFNMRIAAQMAPEFIGGSSRLTTIEKWRALATMSALYGIPVGLSMPFGILPLYDMTFGPLKDEAAKRGINMNSAWFEVLHDGAISTAVHMATGKQYNIPRSLGPQGQSTILNAFSSDPGTSTTGSPLLDFIIGPSGKLATNVVASTYPFMRAMGSIFDRSKNNPWSLTFDDFMDPLFNVAVMNNARKGVIAWNSGAYISRTEGLIAKPGTLDKWDALVMGTLGLTPKSIDNTFLISNYNKHIKAAQEDAMKEIVKEMKRGVEAGARGDNNTAQIHFRRAAMLDKAADLTRDQQRQTFERGMYGHEDMISRVDQMWREKGGIRKNMPRLDQKLREMR